MPRLTPALALALLLPAPALATPPPGPALWSVSDADTVIYLFGTFHALPPGHGWQGPALRAAFARADRLVVETLVGDPQAMGQLLLEMGTPQKPLPPLVERVAADKRAGLAALIARSGVPAAYLDRLETWAAAFMLAQPLLADLGISGADGVEEVLKAGFTARGRPVEGLETVREQLGFVDGLDEADQRLFLAGFVDQAADVRAAFDAMLKAWERGDEAAIARTFDRELKGSPGLRAALLTRRNTRWAESIAARLATPGTMVVAVGAGHLAGADSVMAMLRAKGLKVMRIR